MSLNGAMGMGFVFTAQDLASGHIARVERSFLSLAGSVTGGADRIKAAFKHVGVGLSLFGAGVVTLAGTFALTNKAAEFEQAIAAVGAVSDASTTDIEALENAALKMGIQTQYAPTAAAKGLEELAQAGFNARQSIDLLKPVLDLAAGSLGRLTPESAAGVAVQALRAFRIEANDASVAVDRMVKAANVFSMNAGELPQAIGHSAAGASALNQSLGETLVTFGLMHNIMPGVEKAGTAVSVAMERMADTRTQKALAGIGVSATDAHNAFLPFLDVVKQLAPKLDAMTEKDRASFLIKAFGHHALGGMTAILGQMTQGVTTNTGAVLRGGAAIDYLRDQIEHATGAADKFSKALLNTLAGQEKLLHGSLETLEIMVGKSFAEVFRPVVEGVLDSINTILAIIQATPKPIKRAFATIIVAAGAFLTLVGGAVALQGAIAVLGIAFEILGVSLGAIAETLGVAVAGLALLGVVVAGLKVAWDKNLGGIADRVQRVGEIIKLVFQGIAQFVEQGGFSGALRDELNKAENSGVKHFLVQLWMVGYRLEKFWTGIKEGFVGAIEGAWPLFQELSEAFDALANAVGQVLGAITGGAAGLPSERFRAFGHIVGEALAWIAEVAVKKLLVVLSFMNGLAKGGREVFGLIRPAITQLGEALDLLGSAWDALTGKNKDATDALDSTATRAGLLGRVLSWTLGTAISFAIGFLTQVVQAVRFVILELTVLKTFFGKVADFVLAFGRAIVWFFTEALPSALSSAGHAIERALGKLGDVGASLFGFGPDDDASAAGSALAGSRAVPLPSPRVTAVTDAVRAASAASPAVAQLEAERASREPLMSVAPASASSSTPITVNVQVDGETLARASANASRDVAGRSLSPVASY
jgi:TP901 family phage tail tape measure protein